MNGIQPIWLSENATLSSGNRAQTPENSQSASASMRVKRRSRRSRRQRGASAELVGERRRRADVHADHRPGLVARREERDPSARRRRGCWAGRAWAGSSLNATARTPRAALRRTSAAREPRIPQRDQAQRDQPPAAVAGTTPRPSSRCRPARTRGRGPCRPSEEQLAAEAEAVREAQRSLDVDRVHGLDARAVSLHAGRTSEKFTGRPSISSGGRPTAIS